MMDAIAFGPLRSIESIESIELAHVVHSTLLRLKRDLYIARQQASRQLSTGMMASRQLGPVTGATRNPGWKQAK